MRRSELLRRAAATGALALVAALAAGPASFASVAAVPSGPSGTAAGSQTVSVGDIAEAWYAAAPADTCSAPVGCVPSPVPSSPYPPDTLHVGFAAGQETARSYVQPDLSTVPLGATVLDATMTLPVDTDTQAGSASVDTARVTACLAVAPITDGVQGSTAKPPTIDCSTAQGAKYDAKAGTFTLDLVPFFQAWSGGAPADGIALVPSATSAQTDVWHVAFNGKGLKGAPHITTRITFRPPSGTVTPPPVSPPPAFPTPAATAVAVAPPPALPPGGRGLAPPPAPQLSGAPQASPQLAPTPGPTQVAAQPAAYAHRVHTSLAYIAPLLLLAGVVYLARLFTRDATPARLT